MTKRISFLVALAVGFSYIVAYGGCTPTPAPPDKKAETKTGIETPAKAAWEVKWEEAVTEGKREGKVVIYSNAGSDVRLALTKNFKDKYGLDLEWVMGSGAELFPKLVAERQAGLYLCDVWLIGATFFVTGLKPGGMLDPMPPLLVLPEVTDTQAWWQGKLHFFDSERSRALAFVLYPSFAMFVNSDLVKPDDIKSYQDFLNPKWKGKIAMGDPTKPGAALRWFSVVGTKIMGLEFMEKLVKQEPLISKDERQVVEWVAKEKYAIAFGIRPDPITEFQRAGAPIRIVIPSEGTWLAEGPGALGVINKAPHPNATKVFVNWLLTKEGQTIYSRSNLTQSARVDVPTDHLDPQTVRDPKVKYIMTVDEEFLIKEPEYAKTASQIFAALLK